MVDTFYSKFAYMGKYFMDKIYEVAEQSEVDLNCLSRSVGPKLNHYNR